MTALESIGLGVLVFLAGASYDWCNARYIVATSARRAPQAAMWSMIVGGIGLAGLISVLQLSRWFAIPELAGYGVGTYFAVRRKAGL